jgi:hypothetical protein
VRARERSILRGLSDVHAVSIVWMYALGMMLSRRRKTTATAAATSLTERGDAGKADSRASSGSEEKVHEERREVKFE